LTIGISALATTYARRKNNCARALLILELAEERLPPDSDIIFTHGTVLNMLSRFEEGRALWKRLIDAPDAYRHRPLVDDEIFKWKAPFNIALSYIAEGRYAESLVWIERAQEQKPNSTFIVTRTAAALEQAGAENEAERQYRRWAELEREKGTVELIKFLMRRQRPVDAADVIVKSPWLPPVETVECGIAVATAMIESRTGRPEDLLELVLRLEPANGEALFLYERVMTARTEAVRKAELAAECRSAADFFRRSNRLLELGRHAEAAAAAARAIELDPAHSAAAYTLALATLNQGDEHEAVRLFGLVPTTDHKVFGSAMAARAHLLEEHGDIPGVIATLSRWLDVHWQSHWVTTIPDVSLHRATSAEKANVLR
jgi:tetratricopeptide (TPR) repeat protein